MNVGTLRRPLHVLEVRGFRTIAALLVRAFLACIVPPRCRCAKRCRSIAHGKTGLEIGGPSAVFSERGLLPLYDVAARIDGTNFASSTVWADRLDEHRPYEYGGRIMGRQYVREGTDLHGLPPGTYDFVLSSHAIEHIANPLRALMEWKRVLADGGLMILVVPHRDATFDHRRPITTLEHIEMDFAADTDEGDLTHLPEILELHDRVLDRGAGGPEEFRRRCEANLVTRCLHHHVFDTELAARLVGRAGFRLLAVEPVHPNNIVVVGTKPGRDEPVDNARFLHASAGWREASPFPSDRKTAGQSIGAASGR